MKNIFAICAALCVVLGCISCSSPPELSQPSGEWIDVNPESVLLPGEKMLFKSNKIKKETEQERLLHYGDGKLSGKSDEIGREIRAYTMAARWFEKGWLKITERKLEIVVFWLDCLVL